MLTADLDLNFCFEVIHHEGQSLQSGHYYADVFNFSANCWVRCNDTIVNILPREDLIRSLQGGTSYLLVYRKTSTITIGSPVQSPPQALPAQLFSPPAAPDDSGVLSDRAENSRYTPEFL